MWYPSTIILVAFVMVFGFVLSETAFFQTPRRQSPHLGHVRHGQRDGAVAAGGGTYGWNLSATFDERENHALIVSRWDWDP